MSEQEQLREARLQVTAMREVLRRIYQCRVNLGSGVICRSCWEEARSYAIARPVMDAVHGPRDPDGT